MNTSKGIFSAVLSLILLSGLSAVDARAQNDGMEPDTLAADSLRWSVTPYAGAFLIADDELSGVGMTLDSTVIFGARIGYRFKPHWAFEASYGYGSLTATADSAAVAGSAPLQEVDGSLHVYGGTINYLAPGMGPADSSRARVVLSAGLGGMRYSYDPFVRRNPADERVELIDTSWANELVVLLGAGVEVDAGERVAFRFDVRDHLQFCSAEDTPINETEDFSHCPLDDAVLSNVELSGGVTFRFGGSR